jgi:hypothetical protein
MPKPQRFRTLADLPEDLSQVPTEELKRISAAIKEVHAREDREYEAAVQRLQSRRGNPKLT